MYEVYATAWWLHFALAHGCATKRSVGGLSSPSTYGASQVLLLPPSLALFCTCTHARIVNKICEEGVPRVIFPLFMSTHTTCCQGGERSFEEVGAGAGGSSSGAPPRAFGGGLWSGESFSSFSILFFFFFDSFFLLCPYFVLLFPFFFPSFSILFPFFSLLFPFFSPFSS